MEYRTEISLAGAFGRSCIISLAATRGMLAGRVVRGCYEDCSEIGVVRHTPSSDTSRPDGQVPVGSLLRQLHVVCHEKQK